MIALVAAGSPSWTFRAETAGLSLPVKKGWRFHPDEYKPSPGVPVAGKRCVNRIWFDFIPGAGRELTRQLIDTESLDVTMAIRRWDERTQTEASLAGHAAARLELPSMPERSVYFLAAAGGALVIQVMAMGGERPADDCGPKQPDAAAALVELFFAPAVLARAESLSKTATPPTPKVLEPVPETLEACFAALEKQLSKDELDAFRASTERELSRYHLGLRNAWGLWGGSPLAKSFNELGVYHPDDMSSVIIKSFWRHLNGKPPELEQQVAAIVHYHALRHPPEARACADGKPSRPLFQLLGRDPEKVVSVFPCDAQKTYWAWELVTGWYAPDEAFRKRIQQLRKTNPGMVSGPLEE